jgi:hypothetical protein
LTSGLEHVGRPALAGERQLARVAVDGDDPARPRQPRAGHDLQADAPAADHAHRLALAHPGRVAHRAHPGDDAAADQGGLPQRQGGADRHRAGRRDDAALGEAGHGQEVLDRRAVGTVQPRGAVHQRARQRPVGRRLAQMGPPGGAHAALAAGGHEAEGDPIAGADVGHALPHRLDDAGALVAEHGRPAAVAEVALGQVQIGVAHARRGHPHEHLVVAGRVEQQRLDAQRGALVLQDGGPDLDGVRAHPIR